MDKDIFLNVISQKWGNKVEFVEEMKGGEKVIFAFFKGFKRFWGWANPPNKEEARKKLYLEAWECYNNLKKNEQSLGRGPWEDLYRFEGLIR